MNSRIWARVLPAGMAAAFLLAFSAAAQVQELPVVGQALGATRAVDIVGTRAFLQPS